MLNTKLRAMQMVQMALFSKGISCHIDTACTESESDVLVAVFASGGGNIIESFALSSKTEAELLEWHAEIERV